MVTSLISGKVSMYTAATTTMQCSNEEGRHVGGDMLNEFMQSH